MSFDERPTDVRRRGRIATLALAVALLAALYLTGGLLFLLPSSGNSVTRLAFVALVVAVSWAGVAGAVTDRPPVVVGAAAVLLVLGFWQAVLWIFMLPAALGLVVAGVLIAHTN